MKIIPLSEAKAHLSRYGRICRKEPIIVTVKGVPQFQLAPLDEDDNLVDRLIANCPEFRAMLRKRRSEPTMPIKDAIRRLS